MDNLVDDLDESQYIVSHSFEDTKSTNPTCLICEAEFPDKDKLDSHILAKHTIKKCPKCGPAFRSMSNRKHYLKCGHINTYKCPYCKSMFRSIAQVRLHIRKKHVLDKFESNRVFMCDNCPFVGRSKSSICFHMRRIHWVMFPDFEERVPEPQSESRNCPFCEFRTHEPEILDGHMKSAYWNESRRSFVCPFCEEDIKSTAGCYRHACPTSSGVLPKPVMEYEDCAKCGRSIRKSNILHHQWICSSGQRKFKCSMCNYATYCPTNVRTHFRDAHLTCTVCGKILKSATRLKHHVCRNSKQRPPLRPECLAPLRVRQFSTLSLPSAVDFMPIRVRDFSTMSLPSAIGSTEREESGRDDSSSDVNSEVKLEILKEDTVDNQ